MTASLYPSLALLTDFYQLTMAYGYWKSKIHEKKSVFHLFFRKKPFNGPFAVSAGLENVVQYIQNFHFDASDLEYLSSLNIFEKAFLDYLSNFKFEVDLYAIREGTPIYPYEPLIRVHGALIQCQLLETPLLNFINFPTLIATKAARICKVAKDDPVIEFGIRRAQGIDGALSASRAAFIGGCCATSNVLAGKLFKIPIKGTHAHSWIMAFDTELEAFYAYAKALPQDCIFLVDTYDTIEGIKHAIEVGNWLKSQGRSFFGIRLDSGDVATLSQMARKLLDEAGFKEAKIFVTNELNEEIIDQLKQKGAPIAFWGVGTHLVTGQGQPALDGVYKLGALFENDRILHKFKKSDNLSKISLPGILEIRRTEESDIIFNQSKKVSEVGEDLLKPIFIKGNLVYPLPTLQNIQLFAKEEIKKHFSRHQKITFDLDEIVLNEMGQWSLKL